MHNVKQSRENKIYEQLFWKDMIHFQKFCPELNPHRFENEEKHLWKPEREGQFQETRSPEGCFPAQLEKTEKWHHMIEM